MTYDARVYRTEVYKGSEVTTYWVRWKVGARLWKEAFRKAAQADSFRSALMTAARNGEAFSPRHRQADSMERGKVETTWYEFACAYVDMKWKLASAKYRKDIARALTAAAPAMLTEARSRPDDASIRRALGRWAFNTKQRDEPPADVAEVLLWVRATAFRCRAWPTPWSPGKYSTRPPAAWTAPSRRRARLAGTARSWPTPWITRSS